MPPKTRSTRSAEHERGAPGPKKVLGIVEARLHPEPLRPLNRYTSRGYEVIDFAETIGSPLLPWQQWVVKRALEIGTDGRYRFRVILIMVGRQNGKSHLQRIVTLWRMIMDDDVCLVLGTAQDLPQASNQWKLTLNTIFECPWLNKRLASHRHVNGQESLALKTGAEYMVRSASENAGRGFSVDHLIIDELRTQKDFRAWNALYYTTIARPNSQIWCMSNAGSPDSAVLYQIRDAALSGDETIGLFEWSAPDECDLDDINAWRQANPGLGHTITVAAIRTAMATARPSDFRNEVLCQKVESADSAIDLGAWQGCADPGGSLASQRAGRIAACLDVAMDSAHVTLAVGAKLPDGRVRGEIAASWDSTDAARAELGGILDQLNPVETGWFPSGPAAVLAPILRKRRNSRELKGAEVTEACQGLADLVTARLVIHNDDPLLNSHIGGAQKLQSGDSWRFTRRGGGHCDAAYAFAGMVQVALTMAEPPRARIRILG